jgi:RNA polymerase sigma factor (sigma-70 family)
VNSRIPPHSGNSPWTDLVRRVRNREPAALEDLYQVFCTGIRLQLARTLGSRDLNDKVHDLFLAVTESILSGDVHHPECLMGYVRTVVRRHVASQIDRIMRERRNASALEIWPPLRDAAPNPERRAMDRQTRDLVMRVLGGLRERERQVLVRFYLHEETPEEICRALDLSGTQYRLLKSRAKARMVDLCRRRLGRESLHRPR